MKGRKPDYLKVVIGGKGAYGVPDPAANKRPPKRRTGGMACPSSLKGRARELWTQHILPATWLVAPFDTFKAIMTVQLFVEFERDSLKSIKLSILRGLLSDLGMDPGTRARIAGRGVQLVSHRTKSGRFFDDGESDGAA